MSGENPARIPDVPEGAFTPEKVRHEVAIQRFASPLRDAAPRDLEAFWQNRHTYNRATNAVWQDSGPSNFSGRATCLAMDRKHPKVVYAGSAAGGLWKSLDGAGTFQSCWPNGVSQNIGAVTIDSDNPQHIVCATGEANLSSASYPGSGIYSSEDGGLTWRSFVWIPGKRRMSADDREQMPRRVSSISYSAKDKVTHNRQIAFGSISNDEQLVGGLYLSKQNALEFVERWSTRPYNCYAAVFHPTEPGKLFVTIEAGGTINGIWRTTDGGVGNWERLATPFSGELCGRISLAISEKDPEIMWALVSSRRRRMLGAFLSTNGGESWVDKSSALMRRQGQLAFNNTIAIHPEKPEIVVCGAQDLFLTTDGGEFWFPISEPNRARSSTEVNKKYLHRDQHAILMPGGDVIISANDGGVARSLDLGNSWQTSRGMNTMMFYAIDVSPVNAEIYGGGAQDNGTLLAGVVAEPVNGSSQPFTQVVEGDGGYVVFGQEQEGLVFASTFNTTTSRHLEQEPWTDGLNPSWTPVSPPVPPEEKAVLGLTVMTIKPAEGASAHELLLATNRLWRTSDHGVTWLADELGFDGSAITAIEIASADPSTMFVGTARGGIFRSTNAGEVWSADLAGPEIPTRVITQIETHPTNPRIVVVTVASTGRAAVALRGEARPYSHVFRSLDGGDTWQDIDQGQLPNVVLNGLAFETKDPFRLFVAGDAGPWVLIESSRQSKPVRRWVSIAGNMPSAVISDIIYHGKTRTLTAGTYGRGIWRMVVPARFKITPGEAGLNADDLLPVLEGYLLDRDIPIPEPLTPPQGQTFDLFPRRTLFTCSQVAGAVGYIFEARNTDAFDDHATSASKTSAVEMAMGSASNYVWKCWAVFPDSRCSFPSHERTFQYLR
ncbi:MAG TPA: hypothetical protein VM120_17925 [Bryobacteraceae bacterium]|nr:hypothetical protein [Bryobacteraceae bacterium]